MSVSLFSLLFASASRVANDSVLHPLDRRRQQAFGLLAGWRQRSVGRRQRSDGRRQGSDGRRQGSDPMCHRVYSAGNSGSDPL